MREKGTNKQREGWLNWLAWTVRRERREGHRGGSLPSYTSCELGKKQFVIAALIGFGIVFITTYLFYRSIAAALILATAGIFAPRLHRNSLLARRRMRLTLQFKEGLYSITSSLAAGRSVENAFMTALDDLRLLYPDPKTEVIAEFEIIRSRLAYGEPLEQALTDFSSRAEIDDITQFVDVFVTCKRTGGDLVEVIRRTSQTIGEKLDVQQEIAVMIAQKRYESRIMMVVPFVFLAFLSFAAPDYMAPLYSGIGYIILTVSLALLSVCYWFMMRIMNIRM
ncbi:type II secretion system F family protein [Paenibacillus oenotherae]|uniref:Type II secretion system F family protein n=1 Tax=Paenibacillus oenotherae TaxID=1435645 RepID=A0ABS7DAM0_9BACL|nr:type II secretion system F family protein [Paenibacillus oenotherae]MBW7476547.1 type II secretion system F family protein [Paenibacillus oenotherae]